MQQPPSPQQQQQQQIFKELNKSLLLDSSGKFSEAFIQYLNCLDLISDELRTSMLQAKPMQHDTIPKLFQLSRQCLDRCDAIYQQQPHLFNTLLVKRTNSLPRMSYTQPQQPINENTYVPAMYPSLPNSHLYAATAPPPIVASNNYFVPSAPSMMQPMFVQPTTIVPVPTTPVLERLGTEEHEQLTRQFSAMGAQNGSIAMKQFGESMGALFVRSGIAEHLFCMFDINSSGFVELSDLKYAYAVMTKGTPLEKASLGYRMFDHNDIGFISKASFSEVLHKCYNVLEYMGLQFEFTCNVEKQNELISLLFTQIDSDKDGVISKSEYIKMVTQCPQVLRGIGLIFNQSTKALKRSGNPVAFGQASYARVMYMMLGMRTAHDHMSYMKGSRGAKLTLIPQDYTLSLQLELPNMGIPVTQSILSALTMSNEEHWQFTDYAPLVFRAIRGHFGINEDEYLLSFSPEQLLGNLLLGNWSTLSEKITEGKSGNFFFTTHNGLFMCKTISSGELDTFKRILPEYYKHITAYPDTLQCRYYGLHKINNVVFVVMGNAFDTNIKITEVYDLKGSTIGRTNPGEGVKKDLDFKKMITLGEPRKSKLVEQLTADVKFLEKNSIIDYSLLLGIAPGTSYQSDTTPQQQVARPFYQTDKGGMLSNDGKDIYFVAIIDTLINYGFKKYAEHQVKSLYHGDEHGISVTAPDLYAQRFLTFMSSKIN